MPELSYPKNALNPWVSEETLEYHYGKHHKAYVDKTNTLIEGSLKQASLKEIILQSHSEASSQGLFNASAQAWNHEFYWKSLCPEKQSSLPSELQKILEKQFNSIEKFKEQFSKEALTHFGSGWAWLVQDQDHLKIVSTHDADTVLTQNMKPLLVCDVWEHAYYIDYRNNRGAYLQSFWKIVNWDFVLKNLNQ